MIKYYWLYLFNHFYKKRVWEQGERAKTKRKRNKGQEG